MTAAKTVKLFSSLFIVASLLTGGLFITKPEAASDMTIEPFYDPRYLPEYSPRFFETGGPQVPFNEKLHLKIGIVIRNRTSMSIPYIIDTIFSTAPFDRYKEFFVFANADEAERQSRQGSQFITTYDADGRRIGGGFDWETMRVRAGLVVLDVSDSEFRRSGTLGYAYNQTAVTQRTTILHELGHVLGDLGDEYSIGERENEAEMEELMKSMGKEYEYRMGRNWNRVRANLEFRTRKQPKWFPLVKKGFVSPEPTPRVEIEEDQDVGRFHVPDPACVMNHPEKSMGRFCAVCQLQIIEQISRFTGVKTPWDEYY